MTSGLVFVSESRSDRLEPLDWLRGLMAIVIMVYHLISWHLAPLDSSNIIGRLGVYGVSIFFVLSGLSMAVVYSKYIVDLKSAVIFYIRRIFRIWPLLWVCVALAIPPIIVNGGDISLVNIFINMTTLFGFFAHDSYINTGAWSIGNEMVYYALTPIIIFSYDRSEKVGNFILLLTFALAIYFAFFVLDSNYALSEQWRNYINPFNNLFLYVAGIAIYYNLKDIYFKSSMVVLLFLLAITFFYITQLMEIKIKIVSGFNRLFFMMASIIVVVVFYKFTWYKLVPGFISYPLSQLGIATYGVYLLHPLVNTYFGYFLKIMGVYSSAVIFSFVSVFTIFIALLSFNFFESKLVTLGKKVTSKGSRLLITLWP